MRARAGSRDFEWARWMDKAASPPQNELPLVAVLAAFDTKREVAELLERELFRHGVSPVLCDIGLRDVEWSPVDREQMARQVAERAWGELREGVESGRVTGLVGAGGSFATAVFREIVRRVARAIPKLLISTTVTEAATLVETVPEVIPVWSVTDLDSPNQLNTPILRAAASSIAGLARIGLGEPTPTRPLVAASMLGVTTPCVQFASEILRSCGLEVTTFHAIGSGGELLEAFVRAGRISAVLDVSLSEVTREAWRQEGAGCPRRLTAAVELGIPQVVVPGAVSSLIVPTNSSSPRDLSSQEKTEIPPLGTVFRVRGDDLLRVADLIATRLNRSQRHTCLVCLPENGLSASDKVGLPGDLGEGRSRFYSRLEERLDLKRVQVKRFPYHLCDREFGVGIARELRSLLAREFEIPAQSRGSLRADSE